ncbi:ATP-binding protein [Neglectibacter timonensis]|jgi:predicted AAA+ superfamily ATPase|uniref:ATP-binding protein n=1 Tax=Neglectibacter timonensis TaxID=1776382 RepID=UPI00248DFAFF|nr:ATP-binding protein [Neglectibacter timonensis]
MRLIERDFYLNKLKDVMGTPDIKVITGVRRSGKSKLLESFMAYVWENEPEVNIIHVNFNLNAYENLTEYHVLHDYIENAYLPDKNNFVFIDEVQMCSGFEKAINSLHASEKYDIYITGSNAFLLSSDLATLFTGRTFEIEVFPFSFGEFMRYFELTDPYVAFNRYIQEGGMSGSYLYKTQESKYDYISDVFNTLIVRDIQRKYGIRNMPLMERLCDFLIDNISNQTSTRGVAAAFTREQVKTNDRTISAYIKYLCNAFAFYKVRRYDIQGKRYLTSNDKYYLSDHSFKYAKLGTKNADYGRMIENIVAIELLRRGYELYAGVLYRKEIDFVAIKRSEKLYIQVSGSIDDPDTFKREVDPLLKIRDAYPKMILTRTRQEAYQYEGVQIVDVADWLLQE